MQTMKRFACKELWRHRQLLQIRPNVEQATHFNANGRFSFLTSSEFRKDISHRGYCQVVGQTGDARDINPASVKQTSVMYLDTLAMAKRLKCYGFTVEQAEGMTEAFSEALSTSVEHQSKVTVTKPQQEVMVQQLLAQIASVKKDMVILEKSEFTMIRNDTESDKICGCYGKKNGKQKQGILIKQLQDRLNDDIKKLAGQVKLDINLEKSRAIEAHALNEKDLQALLNRIEVEQANNEKNLKMLDNKIDIELSNLRTQNEKNRNDIQKYFLGVLVSAGTLWLGYLRLVA